MKEAISFENKKKQRLDGFIHRVKGSGSNDPVDLVIFPNGGLMGCEGDFRAYIRISEYLVKHGFTVLRFNPSAIGTSEGSIADCCQKNLFGMIETGLFADDIRSAINYVKMSFDYRSLTLTGICGGGISSILAAVDLPDIDCVIPIGCPVIIDGDEIDYNARMSSNEAKFIFGTYAYKFFSIKAWLRLITFRSDTNVILEVLKNIIISFIKGKGSAGKKNQSNDSGNSQIRMNYMFVSAIKKLLEDQKKILFIYGDSDRFWWEFKDEFLNKYYDENSAPFDYYLVIDGNHMLTWCEMQYNASEKIVDWLKKSLEKKC